MTLNNNENDNNEREKECENKINIAVINDNIWIQNSKEPGLFK